MSAPKDHLKKLKAVLDENRRLVLRGKDLLSDIDQEFAARKERKAASRQQGRAASTQGPGAVQKTAGGRRRILLVEDHPVVSRGLQELINYESDLQVTGIADDRTSALAQIQASRPDLVVLDLGLRERSGLELLKEIKTRFRSQRILILSLHDEEVYASRALRAGAAGYVMKQEATETLFRAIREVLSGAIYLSQAMRGKLAERGADSTTRTSRLDVLSDRELDIFHLIGRGKTTREIADLLCVTLKTVESHRTHIRQKLQLRNATELVQLAIELERDPQHMVVAGS
jgi:DNA-binding NarL/FixJ family response regulator